MNTFEEEVKKGQRYTFGNNWKAYLANLDEKMIKQAEKSILIFLGLENLNDKKFLDVGSGSGLFSLSARRLGAIVTSFDYDPESVACTNYLRSKYFPDNSNWTIKQGSVLDEKFLSKLGNFDIVYSWGVLHHTGDMWKAFENIASLVKENGTLCIAIYNDQGWKTKLWWKIKKFYCSGPLCKFIICVIFIPYSFFRNVAVSILKRENFFSKYKNIRGMSIVYDWFDWFGGFPFEAANIGDIFHFYQDRGFTLRNIVVNNGSGNNEFFFIKDITKNSCNNP